MSWRRLKLKIAVCDDEKFERDRIKDLICIYSVEKNIEIDVDLFKEKMNKILDYMSCEEDKRVIVNQNNKKIIISISDICTIESVKSIRSNSDILITTMSGELYVKGKLKEFNSKYKNMLLFAHRSILVNIMNIYKWMGNRIEMRNGRNVNISRSNMPILKEAFAENVLRRIGR